MIKHSVLKMNENSVLTQAETENLWVMSASLYDSSLDTTQNKWNYTKHGMQINFVSVQISNIFIAYLLCLPALLYKEHTKMWSFSPALTAMTGMVMLVGHLFVQDLVSEQDDL